MTTKRPLDRIGGLKKPTAAADEPAVLDLGRVDAAVEPVASRRGFFRGLLNSGVAAGAASTSVSYTHLDVYKRQRWHRSDRRLGCAR